jgi:putative pyruvate formate lyase activating enzyme
VGMENSEINIDKLKICSICPHNCMVDRTIFPAGKCRTDSAFNIAAITLHKGEEPLISGEKGICNIFFSGCNLQCIYCQNLQISGAHTTRLSQFPTIKMILNHVESIMKMGAKAVGFVTPSHVLPQVLSIIEAMNRQGLNLIKVYNTNAYERPENIRRLEGLIDIYLPDFKYSDPELAHEYSGAADYPLIAAKSIREMYRQKGSKLLVSDDGQAESGLVIRHLVLPGQVENSLNVLRYIAKEISTNVHISLMAQYYPTLKVKDHPQLGRTIQENEYIRVVEEMDILGFRNGWTQEFDSSHFYKPDFYKNEPFSLLVN